MIEFPCHCGFAFSVPDELAGGSLQCPECHWLNEIPTLRDLENILPDGTYVMDKAQPVPPGQLAATFRAFSRSTHDAMGIPIDLRNTMDDIHRVGVGVNEPTGKAHPLQTAPKYDPETGELVRPLGVTLREEDERDAIPMASAAIGYAMPGLSDRVNLVRIYLELFRPANTIVMAFIFLFHMMLQLMILTLGMLIPLGVMVFLTVALIAHYGCIVEDIGRAEKDEVPRPLRDLHLGEDLWWPFCNMIATMILCYSPMCIASFYMPEGTPRRLFALGTLTMLGTILVPAVMLTLLTGGTLLNLRPDRLLGIIREAGAMYVLLVIGWAVAAIAYANGVFGFYYAVMYGLVVKNPLVTRKVWIGSVMLLMGGIYLMHAYCWQLGLLYRAKHAAFPWVFQTHIRQTKQEKMAAGQAMRARSRRGGK